MIAVVNGAAKACVVPTAQWCRWNNQTHEARQRAVDPWGGLHTPEIAAVCIPSIPELVIRYERICASRKKALCTIVASESDCTDNGRLTRVEI